MTPLISLLVLILLVGLVLGVCWMIIDYMPVIPGQFKQVGKVILLLIALLIILARALPMLGIAV